MTLLHYRPSDGYAGDPVPFFWNGTYHLFYLKAPLEPKRQGAEFTSYAHVSTRDFVHWEEHRAVIEPEQGTPDARSCWTGSVLEHEGTFYLFYTGSDPGNSERPQTICLATSKDLDHWTKWPGNPLLRPDTSRFKMTDWRDPFVFPDPAGDGFLMSITTMRQGASFWKGGQIVIARSTDLLHWTIGEVILDPGNHGYPECSDIFEMGGDWYLAASIFDKTCYRIGSSPRGPWRCARTECFDGVMNYAAKTIFDGQNRYVLGWIRTKNGYKDDGQWEWGGNFSFPREIWRDPSDGTLYVRLPRHFDVIRKRLLADAAADPESVHPDHGRWERNPRTGAWRASDPLYNELCYRTFHKDFDIEMEFTLSPGTESAGLVFNQNYMEHPGYEVAVDARHNLLLLRRHTDRFTSLASQSIELQPGEPIRLRVIVDGTILEAFVNDRYALSGRFYWAAVFPKLGFYCEEGGADLQRMRLYELNPSPVDLPEGLVK